jgi:hypothetical protein
MWMGVVVSSLADERIAAWLSLLPDKERQVPIEESFDELLFTASSLLQV